MATQPKLHFLYNPSIPDLKALGESLEQDYSGVRLDEADILVPVGGDGSVLYALPLAKGRMVYGVISEDTSSTAYTVNRLVPGQNLHEAIQSGENIPVHPIEAVIKFQDGTEQKIDVYSSINVIRDSGQAAMMNLAATFNSASKFVSVIGDGVAFSTPLGSTALAYSHGGPIMGPSSPAMIMTGMGLGKPLGMNAIIATVKDSFTVDCITSKGKRPLRIDFDGNTIRPQPCNAIAEVHLQLAKTPTAVLGIHPDSFHPFKRLAVG